jgi:serine/threonine protein kinase
MIGEALRPLDGINSYTPPEALMASFEMGKLTITAKNDLVAHPSYDIWSLGCILYELCTDGASPLFATSRNDALLNDAVAEDGPHSLWEWSDEMKVRKLTRINNRPRTADGWDDKACAYACNLVAQMLVKDPMKRPSLQRILMHPFLSGKPVARMIGEEATFDVFLSYRVASDEHLVKLLYHLLVGKGLRVWWDKACLKPGERFEDGFCAGLMSSNVFVCLLSKEAINSPNTPRQNICNLTAQSRCDNLILEHRLALELAQLGLVLKIYPVGIGEVSETLPKTYSTYFGSTCHPSSVPDVQVLAIEDSLRRHMEAQGLGTPLEPHKTVKGVMDEIMSHQGFEIAGDEDTALQACATQIVEMVRSLK